MKVGYARVSTDERNLPAQIDSVRAAGCERIFEDRRGKVDGARTRGPHAMSYGDFDFGPAWVSADGGDKRTGLKAARPLMQ